MQEAGKELGRYLLGATPHDAQGNQLPYPYRSDVSTQEYVRRLYETFLRRTPDTHAANWQTQADNPNLGRSSVLEQFLAMSAYAERSAALYREINWLIPDHLGTPRFIIERTGSAAGVKRSDYLPFGESANTLGGRTAGEGYGGESVRQGFTGYEEDVETGLDYAQARYYASSTGRFLSPDPLLESAELLEPQSWNRYSYVWNNPLGFIDPSGLEPIWIHNSTTGNYYAIEKDDFKKGNEFFDSGDWLPVPPSMIGPAGVNFNLNQGTYTGEARYTHLLGREVYLGQDGRLHATEDCFLNCEQVGRALATSTADIPEKVETFLTISVDIALTAGMLSAIKGNAPTISNQASGGNFRYEKAPYHNQTASGRKNPAPSNPQTVLDSSVPIKDTTSRRVGVDKKNGEFVVFDEHLPGVFHGHVRPWGDLTNQMQNALKRAGLVTKKGKIAP